MAFPESWAKKVIHRLFVRYGAEWDALNRGREMPDILDDWMMALDGFEAHPDAIAWALDHLPESPPNAVRFRNLARQAPAKTELPALPPASASPEVMARVGEKLARVRVGSDRSHTSARGVLERILAKRLAGEPLSPAVRDFVVTCSTMIPAGDPLLVDLAAAGFRGVIVDRGLDD